MWHVFPLFIFLLLFFTPSYHGHTYTCSSGISKFTSSLHIVLSLTFWVKSSISTKKRKSSFEHVRESITTWIYHTPTTTPHPRNFISSTPFSYKMKFFKVFNHSILNIFANIQPIQFYFIEPHHFTYLHRHRPK